MRAVSLVFCVAVLLGGLSLAAEASGDQRAELIKRIIEIHGLSPEQGRAVQAIFSESERLGTGNPAVTQHPMTPEQCRARRAEAGLADHAPGFEAICGGPHMAPLYDPQTQTPSQATACIDQYEFPNIPCSYPVVWVQANEAAALCEAMGKRLCDAHEWEGACQGGLGPPDYAFELAKGKGASAAAGAMRSAHNKKHAPEMRWSYGLERQKGVCAMGSTKTPGCTGGDWKGCGSNTYPAGAFPQCRSPLGVYDLNGNAAEHMNLPLAPEQMSSAGTGALGVTEMKGSWFIFDAYQAHDDWCRWRAPYWHGGRVQAPDSHRNYHLGFRCCKSITDQERP